MFLLKDVTHRDESGLVKRTSQFAASSSGVSEGLGWKGGSAVINTPLPPSPPLCVSSCFLLHFSSSELLDSINAE